MVHQIRTKTQLNADLLSLNKKPKPQDPSPAETPAQANPGKPAIKVEIAMGKSEVPLTYSPQSIRQEALKKNIADNAVVDTPWEASLDADGNGIIGAEELKAIKNFLAEHSQLLPQTHNGVEQMSPEVAASIEKNAVVDEKWEASLDADGNGRVDRAEIGQVRNFIADHPFLIPDENIKKM